MDWLFQHQSHWYCPNCIGEVSQSNQQLDSLEKTGHPHKRRRSPSRFAAVLAPTSPQTHLILYQVEMPSPKKAEHGAISFLFSNDEPTYSDKYSSLSSYISLSISKKYEMVQSYVFLLLGQTSNNDKSKIEIKQTIPLMDISIDGVSLGLCLDRPEGVCRVRRQDHYHRAQLSGCDRYGNIRYHG